jgi:O-antigen/teichoic acid export membrane protein
MSLNDKTFKKLFKRASYSSTGILIARLSAAIAGIIIARAVGAEQFGVYSAVWALVTLSASFTEIGITSGLIRDGARNPNSLPTLLGNTVFVKAAIGMSSLFVAYFASSLITTNKNAPALFIPLALAGFATICLEPFFAVLYVKGKQKVVALFEIVRGVFFLFGFLILAFGKFNLLVFAWFQGILYIVAFFLVCLIVIPKTKILINLSIIKTQVASSFVFGISSILYAIYSQLPILLLSHFGSEKEVGYFAVALRFVSIIFMIGAGARNNAFLPLLFNLFESNREKFRKVCSFMQECFVPIGIFAAAILYVSADTIIMVLMGEEYQSSVAILRILCWTLAIHYSVLPVDAALTAADRMWTKITFQLFATAIGFISGFLLIKNFGAFGAVFTELTISVSLLIFFVPFAYKKNLFDSSGLKRIILPIGVSVLFSIFITEILPNAYFQRPSLFLGISFLVLGPTMLKISRDYSLGIRN